MTSTLPRRFEFAVPPCDMAWIGEALRRVFPCADDLPGAFASAIERLDRIS